LIERRFAIFIDVVPPFSANAIWIYLLLTIDPSLNPAPLGGSITFTASISGTALAVDNSGSVTFFDGQAQLGAAVSAGPGQSATFTTSNLGVGSHSVTAVYSGNSQFQGSTSSVLTESVVYFVGDFSIQSTPTTATVAAGQSATFQLAVTPLAALVRRYPYHVPAFQPRPPVLSIHLCSRRAKDRLLSVFILSVLHNPPL
jgi:hypothetical protein